MLLEYIFLTWIFISHFSLTVPSIILHGTTNLYRRLTFQGIPLITGGNTNKTILFVHGRGGHHTNFQSLINNLSKLTNEYNFYAIDLKSNYGTTIDEEVERVKQWIDSHLDHEITLIGVSKGGVVCMRYITKYLDTTNNKTNRRIKRVITISSPLKGTKVTKFLSVNSLANKELGYKNDLLTEVEQQVSEIKNKIDIYHVVPKWDYLIIPTDSAKYDFTPENNIYYYNGLYSHVGIPFSNEIANRIALWLYC